MFEIGLVQWLQSFSSPVVTGAMTGVSQLGYTPVYVVLILLLAFTVRLRPSLAVLLGMLFAGVMTEALKTSLALPRPDHVLQIQERVPDRSAAFESGGFWRLPSPAARAAVRATPGISYGFPSGHVGAAMAFCLGLAVFFRQRLLLALSFVWPPLMGLSRMYLGRHFLADVLGGLAVGVGGTLLAAAVVRWLDRPWEPSRPRWSIGLLCAGALGLAVLSVFVPALDAEDTGRLAVLIGCYAALAIRGFPFDAGSERQRAGRFVGALLIYLAISHLLGWALQSSGWEDVRGAVLTAAAVSLGGTLLGGIALGYRTGWRRAP